MTTESQLVDVEVVRSAVDTMALSLTAVKRSTDAAREAAQLRLAAFAKLDAEHERMVKHGAAAKTAWASIHEKVTAVCSKRKNRDQLLAEFAETTLRQYASACTFAIAEGLDELPTVPTPRQAKTAQSNAAAIIKTVGAAMQAKAAKPGTAVAPIVPTLVDALGWATSDGSTIGQVANAAAPKPAPAPKSSDAPTSDIPKTAPMLIAEVNAIAARMADLIGAIKVLTPDADGRKVLAHAGKVIRQHAATIVTTFDDAARDAKKATVAAARPSVGKADAA